MNEEFLSKFRKLPRPEFANDLYERLSSSDAGKVVRGRTFLPRRLGLAFAGILLALVVSLAASPVVRAQVSDLLAKITVHGITIFVDEARPETAGEGETYSEIWTPLSPEQIKAGQPFFWNSPGWVPFGYSLQKEAALYYATTWAEVPESSLIQWKSFLGGRIQLYATSGSCPDGPPAETTEAIGGSCTLLTYFSVGMESEPQIVQVHDEPAVMFRGIIRFADLYETDLQWNPSRWQWNTGPEQGYSLFWEKNGKAYSLVAWSKGISAKDMIRMAESIP
jgi:hypothetical protein